MARIEIADKNDAGRAREWITRAATAARDPVWTADGLVLDAWAPVSPVSGALDVVEWRPPMSGADGDSQSLAAEIADLLAVDIDDAKMIEATKNGAAKSSPAREPGTDDLISTDEPAEREPEATRP
jgi:HemY protein